MIALPHRRAPKTPPPAKVCGSDSYFWVSTPAGVLRSTCGPHLRFMLDRFLKEGGQTLDLAPEPGTPCEWQEATR
jgi:hypothetical protein